MAKALICDCCGETYPQNDTGGNGQWHKVRRVTPKGKVLDIVYGVFAQPRAKLGQFVNDLRDESRGTPADVCPECVIDLLTKGKEETTDDRVPEPRDEGD